MTFVLNMSPEFNWGMAIEDWLEGSPKRVVDLLNGNGEIPRSGRDCLADIAAGKVKKKRGPKSLAGSPNESLNSAYQRYSVGKVYAACLAQAKAEGRQPGGTPTERALAQCADRTGLTVDVISHIVTPRKAVNSRKFAAVPAE